MLFRLKESDEGTPLRWLAFHATSTRSLVKSENDDAVLPGKASARHGVVQLELGCYSYQSYEYVLRRQQRQRLHGGPPYTNQP